MRIKRYSIGVCIFWLGLVAGLSADDFYDDSVLRTLELEFSQVNWWNLLTANYQSKENLIATLVVDGVAYEGVGVRFRGNTSYQRIKNSQKKAFNIEIDYTLEDQYLMGYKTLNLINCMDDPTFMREVLYSNACRQQLPSAKANFVKLIINGENWGIYANIQQLNAEFIEDWFPSNNSTRWRAQGNMRGGDGGANTTPTQPPTVRQVTLTEAGGAGGGGGGFNVNGEAALTWLGDDPNTYAAVYELKNTHQDDPWAPLIHTCDVLNNTSLEALPEVLDDALNVDRALWLCAFEIIFHDDDGYIFKRGSDYYLYYEPETGRLHLMQYDGNSCMRGSGSRGWSLFYRADESAVPLMNRLMAINQYRQRYLAHVRTILNTYMNEDYLWPKIDTYQALIEEQVRLDTKKLYTTQAFTSGISTLKNFIRARHAALLRDNEVDQPVPAILSVDHEVIQGTGGQALLVTAELGVDVPVSEVQLYVSESLYGRFIPYVMTAEGNTCYRLQLPFYAPGTVLRYYVQATADDSVGTIAFSPAGAEHDVYCYVVTYIQAEASDVVINELMASNSTTLADPQGEYDDWIELYNTGDHTIDLSGMYLSDNPENPLKWQIPDGTVVQSGGYVLIWADEDGNDDPGLHANFKLSSKGETLWLYDTDANQNVLLDTVSFDTMEADQSIGRLPNGEGGFTTLAAPSPFSINQ